MAEVPSGETESRGAEHCSLSLYATALSPGITSGYTPQQGYPEIIYWLKITIPFLPRVKKIIQL